MAKPTLVVGAPPTSGPSGPVEGVSRLAPPASHESAVVRGADTLLDLAVVGLATWTVVYHVCLVARWGVTVAVAAEVVLLLLLAAGLVIVRKRRAPTSSEAAPTESDAAERGDSSRKTHVASVLLVVTIGLAVAATLTVALQGSWTWIAWLWIGAALAGSTWAALTHTGALPRPTVGWLEPTIVLVWAVVAVVLSLVVLRPNPDDEYYVNLSQFVAQNGTFPLRDSMFANLVYPMSSWPPMASYDGLMGAFGHLAGTRAAPFVYIVAPAVLSFLAVLAMWRLLRAWRVKTVSIALSSGMIFLLLDGIAKHGPGNLFVTRLYQAKFGFLCFLIPVLLVYAIRYVDRPSRTGLLWLFAGGVAAVGMTTSAIFLTPIIALAGVAPLVRRSPGRAAWGFIAMAAYPLGAGVVTKAVGGRSADSFDHGTERFDASTFGPGIYHHGLLAVIGVGAVLLGAVLLPHKAARITTGLLAAAVGITFIPGFTQLSFDVIGLGPTLWRMSWLLTMGALVGVAVAWLTDRLPWQQLAFVGPVALAGALLVVSDPIWAGATQAKFAAPFHLQRDPDQIAVADRVIAAAQPDDLVLAPEDLSITIDVLTSRIHAVVPRAYFMEYLQDEPGFHYDARLALNAFANHGPWQREKIVRDLHTVGVDTICLQTLAAQRRAGVILEAGFQRDFDQSGYRCFSRR